MLRSGPLDRRSGITLFYRAQQWPHVLLHRQHVHCSDVQQQVEILHGSEELVRSELREVPREGVEVLDVAVDRAILNREGLLRGVWVERVLGRQRSGSGHVDEEVVDGQGTRQTGHLVAVGVFILE